MPERKVKNIKGSEKRSWKALAKQVPEQNFCRVESRLTGSGIPDVWGGDCAVELKMTKNLPVGVTTPVVLDHKLSIPQSRWLNERWEFGFKSFVLVQIGQKNWFLFAAPDSWCLVHGREVPYMQFVNQCIWWTNTGIDSNMFDSGTINEWFKMPWADIQGFRNSMRLPSRYKRI